MRARLRDRIRLHEVRKSREIDWFGNQPLNALHILWSNRVAIEHWVFSGDAKDRPQLPKRGTGDWNFVDQAGAIQLESAQPSCDERAARMVRHGFDRSRHKSRSTACRFEVVDCNG